MTAEFMVALRGYDMAQVDQLLARAEQAPASADPQLRSTVRQELQTAQLRDRQRGYARHQVDHKIEHLIRELDTGQ
jgi:DivIVA domain-containing protein